MKEINFSKFKNESYFQKLKVLASSSPKENMVYAFFGGTGAVGGQTAIEIIQAFEFIVSIKPQWSLSKPLLYITGIDEEEIYRFKTKLHKAFYSNSGHGFEQISELGNDATLILKRKSGVTIELHKLVAEPKFIIDLKELIQGKTIEEIKTVVNSTPSIINSPFESSLKDYIAKKKFGADFKFQAVVSGIPIPSVAAYHFSREIDKVLVETDLKKNDVNKEIERVINIKVLQGFANDFGQIKKNIADEVLIAHTTSVGGMFTIENNSPVIRLGYAHSALDEQLKEKQFYANELTKKYSELNLKILITAAAIGIDNVYTNEMVPINKGIFGKYQTAASNKVLPFPDKLLDKRYNYIFPPVLISPIYPIINKEGVVEPQKRIEFSKDEKNPPPKLKTSFGLRSGENGMFSIDNAYALYLNMKIAIQEELAHILAFTSLFGDDKQKAWFDADGICYQTESENSILVFALLNNRAEFRAYQTSGFTPKAFQDLGSAKHQCELHTIGLYILLHRLKNLNPKLITDKITSKYREPEVIEFVDRNTEPLTIENIVGYDPIKTGEDFSVLLTLNSHEELAKFVGFDGDMQEGFVKTFFQQLFNIVKQTISTITSLGTPIVFHQYGEIKIIAGPYCAAIDSVISHNDTLAKYIKDDTANFNLDSKDYFEWIVCNNGFVDLRPQATVTTAKSHKNGLKGEVKVTKSIDEFRGRIIDIQEENNRRSTTYGYYTTSGTVAFIGRLVGLNEQLRSFDISLGTFNNWKALFPVDSNLHHPVIPGLIEAMRMYSEGLGKVTGFELLYPGFGYYKN
ncbi:MAG: hypothetical protein IPG55_12460 [Saprospiraceae bacterium]|nr:hypothetical protein [Candidatus Defluviibacterium haderslevense]MBK7244371.1 hypothetical protein [Candidatus Defluviibacterium haderslevense]